jgi:hypothetical protein
VTSAVAALLGGAPCDDKVESLALLLVRNCAALLLTSRLPPAEPAEEPPQRDEETGRKGEQTAPQAQRQVWTETEQ